MAQLIDIELIKKWVDISEEELMQRLVKDAIGLQKEAEANRNKARIKKTQHIFKRRFKLC